MSKSTFNSALSLLSKGILRRKKIKLPKFHIYFLMLDGRPHSSCIGSLGLGSSRTLIIFDITPTLPNEFPLLTWYLWMAKAYKLFSFLTCVIIFTFSQEKKQDAQGPLTTSSVWLVSLVFWYLARFDTEQGDCASSAAWTNNFFFLAIVVMWVQALVHLILKGCGWQVIDGGKQGTRRILRRSRYTKLLVGHEGKRGWKSERRRH